MDADCRDAITAEGHSNVALRRVAERAALARLACALGVIAASCCAGAAAQAQAALRAQSLAGGGGHTCALLSTGHVDCWGENGAGALGNGTTTSSDAPVEVQGISTATRVAAGDGYTCALLSTGHVDCWGYNDYGQLGNGTTTNSDTPVEVQDITSATQVAAHGDDTCALLSTGHVDCWGENGAGQLGDGTTGGDSDTPVEAQSISNATQVAASCALLSTGRIDCWGANGTGQLGDGTLTNSDTPVEVQDITSATQVVAGDDGACAVLSIGHVDCWGYNNYGQLGNGTTGGLSDTPLEVQGITSATQVTAGIWYTCVLLSTGYIDCWGTGGNGQLGNGTTTNSDTPVEVQDIASATQVVAGGQHACALLSTGYVDCWGENDAGQLGNGTTTNSDTPVEVVDELPSTSREAKAPAVVTGSASPISTMSERLEGTVNPEGSEVTSCVFEYGLTSSYGSTVACSSLPGWGASSVAVSAATTCLTPGATYHYRIVASNASGTSYGEDQSFTTIAEPTATTAQFLAELEQQLVPGGKEATIKALLGHGGYSYSFTSSGAGALVIDWYLVPKGAHLSASKKPTLIAAGSATFSGAGTSRLHIKLTRKGRQTLKHSERIMLTVSATFTPTSKAAIHASKTFTLER